MKKALVILIAALMLCPCASAVAENAVVEFLKPVWLKALEEMRTQNGAANEQGEPYVVSASEGFEAVRGTVHLLQQYDTEAYIYAELKNTGEQTVRVSSVTLTLYDWNGKKIDKAEYAGFSPEVILPGESIYVNEWMYDFAGDIGQVGYAAVEVEESAYSRRKIEVFGETRAYIEGDYLYVELTNPTEQPVFEVAVVGLALGADGEILDMLCDNLYGSMGIAPGSTVIFRKYLQEHAFEQAGSVFEVKGFRYMD